MKYFSNYYIIIGLLFFQIGCNNSEKQNDVAKEIEEKNWELEDGTYCGYVLYNNPRTKHKAKYKLRIAIANNSPVKFYFCNGGYLDNFNAPELDENHSCDFVAFDQREYSVSITDEPCSESEICSNNETATYTYDYCCKVLELTASEIIELEKSMSFIKGDLVTGDELEILRRYIQKYREMRALKAEVENGQVVKTQKLRLHGNINSQVMIIKKFSTYYLCKVAGQTEVTMGTLNVDETNWDWQTVFIKEAPRANYMQGYQIKIVENNSSLDYLEERINMYLDY
jgi:hypothetical protein